MSSLVSIIIPTYNRQDVLEECVQSVLVQSYPHFEVLLIDDGSTDQSPEVCQALAKRDNRVRFFAADHGGVSAARNIGLEKAAGDYFFFLDSDDVIHPLLLEALVLGLDNTDAGIAATDVVFVSEKNWFKVKEKLADVSEPGKTSYQSHEETLQTYFDKNSPLSCIGGVMMRRDLIGETKFNIGLFIAEDARFIYENLTKGASTIFLEQKWYYTRLHKNNSSWDWSYSGFMSRFNHRKMVWENEDLLGRKAYSDQKKRDAVSCYLSCAEKNKPYSEDNKKMRKVIKEHWKVLFPALVLRTKLHVYISVYLPFLFPAFRRTYSGLQKLYKKVH